MSFCCLELLPQFGPKIMEQTTGSHELKKKKPGSHEFKNPGSHELEQPFLIPKVDLFPQKICHSDGKLKLEVLFFHFKVDKIHGEE